MKKVSGHKIFLLDAAGALVSVIFLSFLYAFDDFFGMPQNVIKMFLGIATAFFVYSTTTFFIKPTNWQLYLKFIAVLNISYCLFTFYHILQNLDTLTLYGYAFFIAEIFVILILSTFELKKAGKQRSANSTYKRLADQ
ncbi:MAG: hypothetical protein LAT57_06880 [Balneolales bacterium]|nr:hypothetical protein [Balneolales bacterium]